MKKIVLLMAAVCLTAAGAWAQEAHKVTLEMSDSSTITGYNHTEFVNTIDYVEVSQTPTGLRMQYRTDDIERVFLDDSTVYVKKPVIMNYGEQTPSSVRLLRRDYVGKGIIVYSAALRGTERIGDKSTKISKRNYYLSMGDDPAVWVGSEYALGGNENQPEANRALIAFYFRKRYPQYEEFANRFKGPEFSMKGDPTEIVKAWEEEYAPQEAEESEAAAGDHTTGGLSGGTYALIAVTVVIVLALVIILVRRKNRDE